VILADFLLAPFVDRIFAEPGLASVPFHVVAAYSFAFQIYFDFSGYTDMARGMALLLGYELPLNFREPYLSRNPNEFWQRWHITLSQWLRDYLYIPLGGNRHGAARTNRNLLITMLLGGLWHGAAWNFVIWGGLHGLLLMLHRQFRGPQTVTPRATVRNVIRILLFFHVTCALWIPFRAPSLDATMLFVGGLLGSGFHEGWPLLQSIVVLVCGALHIVERVARERLTGLQARLERSWWGAVLEGATIGATVAIAFAVAGAGGEFIYFQF
jgi:D-alanyl-lipoteichoic acid acyltransferase DltB (MBOAT superfamily)